VAGRFFMFVVLVRFLKTTGRGASAMIVVVVVVVDAFE